MKVVAATGRVKILALVSSSLLFAQDNMLKMKELADESDALLVSNLLLRHTEHDDRCWYA